jgi:SAM-dependent methyltransferase
MSRRWLRSLYRRFWVLPRMQRTYAALTLPETFRAIYLSKAWGDCATGFYSGAGSRGPAAEQYCNAVIEFIREHGVRSVLDLGCGDFAVGRRIVEASGIDYTGIDVVPELIERHQHAIRDPRVSFRCADITCDPLPEADLYLIRQVLQHLSNDEISRVLANVRFFRFMLISEDVPLRPRSFNRDKPHGPDVRTFYGSGVFPDRPPFSLPAEELWTFGLRRDAVLRTLLFARPATENAA